MCHGKCRGVVINLRRENGHEKFNKQSMPCHTKEKQCNLQKIKNGTIFKELSVWNHDGFFYAMIPDSFGVPTMSPLCVPTSPNPFTCSETALATQRRACQGTHQKRTDTSSCPRGVGDMLMLAGHLKQENFPRI